MSLREPRNFGEMLRDRRRAADLTQEELAERAGLSDRAVRKIERGLNHAPRKATVQLLADALQLDGSERDVFKSAARAAAHNEQTSSLARSPSRTNLPDDPTSFVGRERECAQVASLLQRPDIRLVTLTGTGGSGKTRLALRIASQVLAQYGDGVFFVSLAPLNDPELVLSTMGGFSVSGSETEHPLRAL